VEYRPPSSAAKLPNRDNHVPSTFAALRHRNYSLWFFGQTVSQMGTWMQSVAQGWVVYALTGSDLALGTISFLGALPTLFLMLPAGVVVDRSDKRRLLLLTQTAMMLLAFTMAILAATNSLRVWHIGLLATLLGIANSFDAPTRQAMVVEMVDDRRDLTNAIALNSTIFNLARVVGPAIGGVVLAAFGAVWCFGLNGLSFVAVILAVLAMRINAAAQPVDREPLLRQARAGLGYVRQNPVILALVAITGFSAVFASSYGVLLPAFAADVLHTGEVGLGGLNAAIGAGALIGSLTVATFSHHPNRGAFLVAGCLLYPGMLIGFALSRYLVLSYACLALAGWAIVVQNANINTVIQASVPDQLRGRVMAVYMLTMWGATPFGSLQAGTIAQVFGPRAGVGVGAVLALVFAIAMLVLVPGIRTLRSAE